MNIYENIKRQDQIAYKFYMQSRKSIKDIAENFGLDIGYFISNNYHMQSNNLFSKEKKNQMGDIKQAIDYHGGQSLDVIDQLISSIREYREKSQRNSIGTDDYMKKFDIYKITAERTKEVAKHWWSEFNARTYVDVKSERGKEEKIIKGESQYSSTEIYVSPLWYHKVYKHGLHGVQYKGRPCFVMNVTHNPIRRLLEDNIDTHKATILHSHGGKITKIDDMWLASFKQSEYEMDKEGKVIKPSERVLSVSPDLRRAETNVSQRIGRNVIGSLLS